MKQEDFLGTFVGSQSLGRMLRLFLLNDSDAFAKSEIAKRIGVAPREAESDIKILEGWGLLRKGKHVRAAVTSKRAKKPARPRQETVWFLNPQFEHLRAVSNFVNDVSPAQFDSVAEALKKTGKLAAVVLSGTFMNDPSRPADLIVAVDDLNKKRLETALRSLEQTFGREIRYAAFTLPEFRYRLTVQDKLLRDTLDFPHMVILDRTGLL